MTASTDEDLVEYIQREVDELLGAGPVGLYEFVDIALGRAPEMSRDDRRKHAEVALRRLRADPDIKLAWDVWAQSRAAVPAGDIEPTAADWDPPTDEPYLTVVVD